jgi:AMMECR1 domain-containing protein
MNSIARYVIIDEKVRATQLKYIAWQTQGGYSRVVREGLHGIILKTGLEACLGLCNPKVWYGNNRKEVLACMEEKAKYHGGGMRIAR